MGILQVGFQQGRLGAAGRRPGRGGVQESAAGQGQIIKSFLHSAQRRSGFIGEPVSFRAGCELLENLPGFRAADPFQQFDSPARPQHRRRRPSPFQRDQEVLDPLPGFQRRLPPAFSSASCLPANGEPIAVEVGNPPRDLLGVRPRIRPQPLLRLGQRLLGEAASVSIA